MICLIRSVACLTCGAGTLKVLAAIVVLQAAEVTGTLLASGEYLTTTTHTAALKEILDFTKALFSYDKPQ